MASFVFPNDTQRLTVIGKTGSGKTQGSLWQLSQRSITRMPWIVFDFKLDPTIADIPGVQEISVDKKPPTKPGLYVVHPRPGDDEAVENFLWQIWSNGNTGVYIDEGYMIGKDSDAFQALLTQGRSKHIPVIMLTQRPTWVSRFVFSEADFIQLYQLTDQRDLKTVREFMPMPIDKHLLPAYHSWWYDSGRHYKAVLKPAPDKNNILSTFHARIGPKRDVI